MQMKGAIGYISNHSSSCHLDFILLFLFEGVSIHLVFHRLLHIPQTAQHLYLKSSKHTSQCAIQSHQLSTFNWLGKGNLSYFGMSDKLTSPYLEMLHPKSGPLAIHLDCERTHP
jgi:hypothetical protein